jgi:hypothetical protein
MGFVRLLFGIMLVTSSTPYDQNRSADRMDGAGVSAEYAGKWTCQAGMPGYNLPGVSTPPTTIVMTFSIYTDGTYDAPNTRGHYLFHSAQKTIEWLDGLHRERFSKTELARRSNGAPSLSLIANQRRFGCFLSRTPGTSAPIASQPASRKK